MNPVTPGSRSVASKTNQTRSSKMSQRGMTWSNVFLTLYSNIIFLHTNNNMIHNTAQISYNVKAKQVLLLQLLTFNTIIRTMQTYRWYHLKYLYIHWLSYIYIYIGYPIFIYTLVILYLYIHWLSYVYIYIGYPMFIYTLVILCLYIHWLSYVYIYIGYPIFIYPLVILYLYIHWLSYVYNIHWLSYICSNNIRHEYHLSGSLHNPMYMCCIYHYYQLPGHYL